jgi:hypothetical protein
MEKRIFKEEKIVFVFILRILMVSDEMLLFLMSLACYQNTSPNLTFEN